MHSQSVELFAEVCGPFHIIVEPFGYACSILPASLREMNDTNLRIIKAKQ